VTESNTKRVGVYRLTRTGECEVLLLWQGYWGRRPGDVDMGRKPGDVAPIVMKDPDHLRAITARWPSDES
jgi:hypothetical protein